MSDYERMKKWRRDNPERWREIARRTYAKHRTKRRSARKKWDRANPDKLRAYIPKRRIRERENRSTPEGWAKHRIHHLRRAAKRRGFKFALTWRDILPPTHCPVFGVRLVLVPRVPSSRGRPHDNAASVDRRNNRRGYVRGNVVVMSLRANMIKRDASTYELFRLLDYLTK